jgi:hypothetical protein
MLLYRAVSYAELQDILVTGQLRPGPPSFQGKWFAESPVDAARWGRRLSRLTGGDPFHLIEVEVDDAAVAGWFRLPNLDQIGPARYGDIPDLPAARFVREVLPVPTSPP